MTKNLTFNRHNIKVSVLTEQFLGITKNNLIRKSLLWASFENFLIMNHTDIMEYKLWLESWLMRERYETALE